jgi:peptidoglycan hydrolase-like protein with peptidoglycan-binding domain
MASNGQLPDSALLAIPGGRLAKGGAAENWLAGPAKHGLLPLGPTASSYRTLALQQYYWNLYISGQGNLAAQPGTSNHGWGTAVDLKETWMRAWIDQHGAPYGWAKTEAFSEWWHVNYRGGVPVPPVFAPIKFGMKGPRVKKLQKLLFHAGGVAGHPYAFWPKGVRRSGRFGVLTKRMVKKFQKSHGLVADGVVGEKTWDKLRHLAKQKARPPKGKR